MEPWIGWIRLADGRRQAGGHPGIAWLTPPLHPAPGRESERFAMALDLSGPVPSRLYREIRDAAAQAFWSTPGSPVAALRRAVMAANRTLVHFNHPLPPEGRRTGSLVCAALRDDEAFLAHAGGAGSWALSADGDEHHPERPLPPLGSRPYAEMALTYIPLRPGMALVLSTRNLLGLASPDALGRVLRREGEEILAGLEQLAGEESLTAMVLRWPEERPAPPPAPPAPRRREAPSPPVPPPAPPPPPEETRIPEEVFPPEKPARREGGAEEEEEEWAAPDVWTRAEEPRPPRPSPKPFRPGERLRTGFRAIGGGLARGGSAVRRSIQGVAVALYPGARRFLRRTLPGAERRRTVRPRAPRPVPQENPRRMAILALVILILVILTTLIAWLRYGQDLRRQEVLSRAWEEVQAAQQAPHPERARPHWEAVLALTANDEDPQVSALHAMAQDALDQMDGTIRVAPTLLADLGSQVFRDRLVAWEQSVAVLADQSRVRRVLIGGGSEFISIPGAPPLIDITVHRSGPGQPPLGLLILGAGGHLWAYDPQWPEPRPVTLSPIPGGHDPVAMATYAGRLYLLDPAGGQIWRYIPQNGEFGGEGEPYFSSSAPLLQGARDMALTASIYVLFEDGGLARYERGESAPFVVNGVPAPPAHFIALAVDPGREKGPVYLADEAGERIVVLQEDGAFCAQFRPPGEEFRGLQALAVSPTGDSLFVLARGRIYRLTLPPLPCP